MEKTYFDKVVYQIYPRSFCDSNGDGIGDIPGIISRLDYLKELGISVIWLSPVYKTANADFGYDVADYLSINPEYGTMKDMDKLLTESKKRGIRIIMDLVVNHTSDEHEWFKSSINPDSPYRDFYYWRKGKNDNKLPPNNWTSNFGGPAWTYVKEADAWYLHIFDKKQPDLDWHNPKVLEEVEKILTFWLDKGVYGFRCDVINQIWKESLDDGKKKLWRTGSERYLMKDMNHEILKKINEDVISKYDCMMVGETSDVDFKNARRFLDGELDMVFQFDTSNSDKWMLPLFKTKFKPKHFKDSLIKWQKNIAWNANFFENHDQPRSISRYGDVKDYPLVSGKMLATILLTLKGTPFIYQGEEIGMRDYPMFQPHQYVDSTNIFFYNLLRKLHVSENKAKKLIHNFNRDNARLPVQWDDGKNAGFSTSDTTWLPVNPDYKEINVKLEENDPNSLLSYYKKVIKLRNEIPAFQYGEFEPCQTPKHIMAYWRSYKGEMYFIVANLSKKKRALPGIIRKMRGKVILSNYEGAGFTFKKSLRPYETIVAKLK